mgnify:CR=1 FL=1
MKSNDDNYKLLAAAVIERAVTDLKNLYITKAELKKSIKQTQEKAILEVKNSEVERLENTVKQLREKERINNNKIKATSKFFETQWFELLCGIVGVESSIIKNGVKQRIAV